MKRGAGTRSASTERQGSWLLLREKSCFFLTLVIRKDGRAKDWAAKMSNTFISFYLKDNKIHIFTDTLHSLGNPDRICIMMEQKGKRLLLLPHTKKDFVSHRVPEAVYKGTDSMEVNSKKLCRLLADQHGWDVSRSYRAPGVIIQEKKLAAFDLARAEII